MNFRVLVALFFSSFVIAFPNEMNSTNVVRCAFDIGSGTTNILVALVNPDSQIIIKTLYKGEAKVGYKQSLGSKNALPSEIVNKGISEIKTFLEIAAKNIPSEYQNFICKGIATEAFRLATENGALEAARISRETGVEIKIINQEEEGQLGFFSAVSAFQIAKPKLPLSKHSILVWDIGAGSQQFSQLTASNKINVLKSKLASESLRAHVVMDIQKKAATLEAARDLSPNPISLQDATKAQSYVSMESSKISADWKQTIKNPDTFIIGLGGVLGKSVASQCKIAYGDELTLEHLETVLQQRLGLSDTEIGEKYAVTHITNLILVAGSMKSLGIQRIKLVDDNLADALVVHPEYWK